VIAIDTNVVVRFIVKDDLAQFAKAERLLAAQPVLVLNTVLLEAEWVLRKVYLNTSDKVGGALKAFVSLETVHTENIDDMIVALDAYAKGMDFADAMHLAQAAGTIGFASFDKSLQRTAKRLGGFVPVTSP
jgi:predicted nucleic-acid-binding protein